MRQMLLRVSVEPCTTGAAPRGARARLPGSVSPIPPHTGCVITGPEFLGS